jgi:7-cyano-7-deazaguanine synthase
VRSSASGHTSSPLLQRQTTVLLSGGIDSSACVAFYLDQARHVNAIFVDYGQSAAREEARASAAIAAHFQIGLRCLKVTDSLPKPVGLIPGRNAFLYLLGLLEATNRATTVATGIHAGTDYWDCSGAFLTTVQRLFEHYTDGKTQAAAPFLSWTKRQVWDFIRERGVPLALTYSCERGGAHPCGQCHSCRDLEALRACS